MDGDLNSPMKWLKNQIISFKNFLVELSDAVLAGFSTT